MIAAFTFNALFAGLLIYGAATALSSLFRGRAAYLIALLAFLLALVVPFGLTRPESQTVADVADQPSISVDAKTPWFTPVWIAGTMLLLLREIRGYIRLSRIRGQRLTREQKVKLGWPTDDDRVELADVPPMTLASRVLIRAELLESIPIEIARAIVRHERAHLRWRDPIVGAALRLLLALFWPAAPLWLLDRLVRRERESAADLEAVRGVEGHEDYARALVAVARGNSVGAAAGFASELEHRVNRLMQGTASPLSRIAALLAAGVTAAGVAFVPAVRFDGPAAPPSSPSRLDPMVIVNTEPAAEAQPPITRRRIEAPASIKPLPAGSRFGETVPGFVEAIPTSDNKIANEPVTVISEMSPPPERRRPDRDVHVDVRRHVHVIRHVDR